MDNIATMAGSGQLFMAALAGFVCGVALLYLVIVRTMKHRANTAEQA